jgi:hypothetical protein
MLTKSRELIYSLIAIGFITLAYLFVQTVYKDIPSASSLWGHSLGVLGFILMLMTEILYSLRKRSTRGARWGKMSGWLEFHIFTGLVGPYMVLLHPGWKFQGLAGVLSLLTVLMVISGFIGRYIYTAVPRAASGAEISLQDLQNTALQLEAQLARMKNQEVTRPVLRVGAGSGTSMGVLSRFWYDLRAMINNFIIRTSQTGQSRQKALELAQVKRKYDQVVRQIRNLAAARRLLALWHTVHIPLGLTLFIVGFIHIGATIYYSVLLY